MKVFQLVDGICYYDATSLHASVAEIPDEIYAPELQFIDAPDEVQEGWIYADGVFSEPIIETDERNEALALLGVDTNG
jgi:hypothetical protein